MLDLGAIATLASGLISTAGSLYSNKQNLEATQNTNKTNWYIAALNNATQIDMANTSHQREVRDLEEAGLNPILSANGSGAATPSLTSVRGDSAQIENPTEGLANSAKSLARYVSKQYEADLKQTQADAEYAEQDASRLKRENMVDSLKSKNEMIEQTAINTALHGLAYRQWRDDDGVYHDDFDSSSPYVQEIKKGLMSEAKNKANMNWRNNLDSISRGVNSASSLLPWSLKKKLKGIK